MERKYAVLLAATILAARKLNEIGSKALQTLYAQCGQGYTGSFSVRQSNDVPVRCG